MKKFLILFLTVTLLLGIFISCDKASHNDTCDTTDDTPSEQTSKETTTDTSEETTEETSTEVITTEFNPEDHGYTIEKVNEEYYIKFLGMPKPTGGHIAPSYPSFNTIQDFYNKLNRNKPMDDYDLEDIYHSFEKDDIGYKIFDIETIYYPVLPDGITFEYPEIYVVWWQYKYGFTISYDGVLLPFGIRYDGQVCILTRYEDYLELYNSEKYSNATVLTEGNKEARVTVQFYEDDYADYYEYRVLLKSGDVYAEIQLAAYDPFEDNSIFLNFDFVKYEG